MSLQQLKQQQNKLGLPVRPSFQPAQTSLPRYIIMEASDLRRAIRSKIDNLPVVATYMVEEEELVNMVLTSIAFEPNYEFNLEWDISELIQQAAGTHWAADMQVVAEAMLEFGFALHARLHALNLYVGNWLYYQYATWVDNDLMLHLVDCPQLPSCRGTPNERELAYRGGI